MAGRYQAVTDLLGDLRNTTVSAAQPTSQPDVPSIAVLPFADMSPQKDQDYFCEGMAEEIINALTKLEGLKVASRTSAFQAKARDFDMAEIGTRLKVGAVLEGSVRKAGNRLRVTAQLINVSDGYHLWSERYDRDMDDVFAVQDEIAQSVVEKLKVRLLGAADEPLVKPATDNLEAYNLVLEGRYHLIKMSEPALKRSLECFTQALALEPSYAQAHAGIARAQVLRGIFSLERPHAVAPIAREAALRALEIDETLADAHYALAGVMHWYEWDWAGAEREYCRALELNPGNEARGVYAQLLAHVGRIEQAVAEAEHFVERDPLSPQGRQALLLVLLLARESERVVKEAKAGIELHPTHHMMHMGLGWGLAGLARYDEAADAFREAEKVAAGDPVPQAKLGWALGLAGKRDQANAILEDLQRRRDREYFSGWLLAHVHLGSGQSQEAITWLERAVDEHDGILPFLNFWYSVDPLRSDPRFQALLRRMNFPQSAPSRL